VFWLWLCTIAIIYNAGTDAPYSNAVATDASAIWQRVYLRIRLAAWTSGRS
jgi:hypothetical protein